MTTSDGFLEGKFLIAMPSMPDERFSRTVIFMCAHSDTGAMGLVINRVAEDLSLGGLLAQLNLLDGEDGEHTLATDDLDQQPIHLGGPVETKRGFVLHSNDYFSDGASVEVARGICLTATVEILRAFANGTGPRNALLALGYAGWAGGQIEREIQANSWLHADAPSQIIFETDIDQRYEDALALLGVDPSFLVGSAGHA
ncbi:MAG: YqgE/AlgH family protein [Pseudomonadota bacterium]